MPGGPGKAVWNLLDSFTWLGAGETELEAHRMESGVLAPEGAGGPPDGRVFTGWAQTPQLPLPRSLWLWHPMVESLGL